MDQPAKMMRLRALLALALGALLVWAAPLVGLALSGRTLASFLGFPPRAAYVPHEPFAWDIFMLQALPVVGVLALYSTALARAQPVPAPRNRRRFPPWGWIGIGMLALGWLLAWSDGLVVPELRRHTFSPIWLGYIIVLNALVYRSSGRSPLTHRTGWFLSLFPVSALLWWLFEYLNQFVDNWYYVGIRAVDDWDYFVQATLPFATVLPAIASTWAWLRLAPRLDAMSLPILRGHGALAAFTLLAGIAALAGIGIWPETLFPQLWLAPLLVFIGLQRLLLGETLLAPLHRGDWRPLLQPALAALLCGILWEMWNYGSSAKWQYSIPYVQRFHVFEMPILGYAGYLPFGLECAIVMDLVARVVEGRALWPLDGGGCTPSA
jgi:hypothetical protein